MVYYYFNKMVRIEETLGDMYMSISEKYRSETDQEVYNIGNIEKSFVELCNGQNEASYIKNQLHEKFEIEESDFKTVVSFFKDIELLAESLVPVTGFDSVYKYNKPFEITYDITSECNCNCLYCLNSSGKAEHNELTMEQIIQLFKKVVELRPNHVAIGGGEPLLRLDEVLFIIRLLSQNNIDHVLFTNSTLINESTAKKLKDAGLKAIRTSIDGHEPWLHDKLRNRKGCLEEVEAAIKIVKKQGIKVYISSTINSSNFEYLSEIKRFTGKLGDFTSCYPVNPLGRGTDTSHLLTNKQYVAYLEENYGNSEGNIDFIAFPKKRCAIGENLFISPTGNVYPCWTLAQEGMTLANVLDKDFEFNALYSRSTLLRSCLDLNVDQIKNCSTCKIKYICYGGCRGNAYSLNDDLYARDNSRCAAIQEFTKNIYEKGTQDSINRLHRLCSIK